METRVIETPQKHVAESVASGRAVRTESPEQRAVPDAFIYEMRRGAPVYYRGYEECLDKPAMMEKCMGSSVYQSFVISTLLKYLFQHLPDKYEVLTNELGILLGKKDWRSSDIAICERERILKIPQDEQNTYLHFAPKVVIEIDTKADTRDFASSMDYYVEKTNDLLDFGVERVVWIFTGAKKVMTATKGNPWQIVDWKNSVEIIDGLNVSLERDLNL